MARNKNYTRPIVSLAIFLVLISITILTVFNINSIREYARLDTEEMSNNYIENEKISIRDQTHFFMASIKYRKNRIESRLDNLIKNQVDNAIQIANKLYENNKDNLSDANIQNIIKTTLKNYKFNNKNGYFFAVDLNTEKIIVHKVPKLIGYVMTNHRDAKGLNVLKLQKELLAKQDGAFHNMYFTKPGSTEEYPKRVYVRKFKPFNWLIGTGEYRDVVEELTKSDLLRRFNDVSKNDMSSFFVMKIIQDDAGKKWLKPLISINSPELNKSRISQDTLNSKGEKYIQEYVNLAETTGSGYLEYWSRNDLRTEETQKISYINIEKDWNWIVGNGFYFYDLNTLIEKEKKELKGITQDNIIYSVIVAILLSLISILIAYKIALKINVTITKYTNEINHINESLLVKIDDAVEENRRQEQIIYQQKRFADMGQMINAIAHQWRQPINNIYLTSQMLKDMDNGMDYNISREDLYTQQEDLVNYMSKTIDDFRNYFSTKKEKHLFSIAEEIEKSTNLISAQLSSHQIDVSIECDANDCTDQIMYNHFGYVGEFRQVVMSVLSNAKDAIIEWQKDSNKNDGKITIRLYEKSNMYHIVIENTGHQIPKEVLPRIFHPYFTTKEEGKGTGIGLYMSRTIIENDLKGKLYATNTNTGVAFHIELLKEDQSSEG